MTISPFDLLLLLGSLQGFILASLLGFSRKGNRLSNRLLAWLIGLLALASLAVSIPIFNKWVSLTLDLAPLINAMPFGPPALLLHQIGAVRSQDNFFVWAYNNRVAFKRDASGRVVGYTLREHGEDTEWKKTD